MNTLNSTIPQSIQQLIKSIEAEPKMTPKKAKELVEAANITAEDLMPYADFEHPVEDCYGRKMLYDAGAFEIMVMSWNPGDFSAIHNHGYTEWGAVQVFGTAQHNIFNLKEKYLTTAKKEVLMPGEVVKVNNALIHQMGNSTTAPYLTLHLYGCNTRNELVTADSYIYELEKKRIVETTGGAFFNLSADEVKTVKEELSADEETYIYYTYLLLEYYKRLPNAGEMKQELLQQMQDFLGLN
jgi:cysteine dioxygenase